VPLVLSSKESYTRPVASVEERQVDAAPSMAAADQGASPPQRPALAVAVVDARSFRAVILGDADFASNSLFPYMANSDLALATIRWLVREERPPAVTAHIPVPPLVLLTKRQMQQIFLLTEVLPPLSVLVLGVIVWWKRR
jgi:ABC-type uncharacterized transport system involved in gliding motility auxiliary subunit